MGSSLTGRRPGRPSAQHSHTLSSLAPLSATAVTPHGLLCLWLQPPPGGPCPPPRSELHPCTRGSVRAQKVLKICSPNT